MSRRGKRPVVAPLNRDFGVQMAEYDGRTDWNRLGFLETILTRLDPDAHF
jgi:hypothetical protein